MGKGAGKGGERMSSRSVGRKITLSELSEHRTKESAWMSYHGKVYDVSNWEEHPGGSVIFTHAGDDATDIMAAFHPPNVSDFLDRFYVGELDETVFPKGFYANKKDPKEQKAFEKGYRALRSRLIADGYFEANLFYYAYKVLSNVAIAAASIYCAVSTDNLWVNIGGAVLMALFWQQCGWLAHDFLHHQVFKSRYANDVAGVVIGDFFQGFSVHWWKGKHNAHHAVPNLHASSPDAHDGDPDINTMPLLAWTKKMASFGKDSKWARFFISWQNVFYFPILFFARLSWANESAKMVFGGKVESVKGAEDEQKHMQYPVLEQIGMGAHYAVLGSVLYNMPGGWVHAAIFFFLAQTVSGLFLAVVFGLGHNGMSVYPADERPDFWKLQVSTTRNITSNFFVDWFCGGLQYQVDHHLFPQIPRHNLRAVHEKVVDFCKEFNVTYHEANMWDGTVEVLSHLSEVAAEFVEEFPAM